MRHKKLLFPIILFSLSICGCSPVSNTDNGNNGGQDNDGNGNNNNEKKFELDFSNCIANIQDAQSLKISRKSTSNNQIKRTKSSSSESFLYKSTEDYESAIEVSFIRYTTTIVTEEVTGESVYTANPSHGEDRGFILIYASESFSYSVFDKKDREIVTNIQDNSQGDSDERIGFIRIGNLIPNNDYLVKYKGYREVEEITQETLEAEIDKLYVYSSQFTFVSFVPKGESQRPSDDKLSFDKDGISFYDKENYTNEEFRKSFVFDNYSGFIYSLENLEITKLDAGLAFVNNEYCDLSVNDGGSLLITPIVKNKTLKVSYAFKDKYGNKFVLNDKLETYDQNTNTYYYVTTPNFYERGPVEVCSTPPNKRYIYVRTILNEVIRFPYSFEYMHECESDSKTVDLLLKNGECRQITESDSFDLVPYNDGSYFTYEPQKVKNGVVFIQADYNDNLKSNSFRQYWRDEGMYYLTNNREKLNCYNLFAQCMHGINPFFLKNYDVMFIMFDNTVYSFEKCYEYALYRYNKGGQQSTSIWLGNGYMDFEVDGVYIKELASEISIDKGKLVKYGVDGNIYYNVCVEGTMENPEIKFYETGTYTPQEPEELAIIIQPINRE